MTNQMNIEDLEHDEDLRLTHQDRPVDGEVVRLDDRGRVAESVHYRRGIKSGWSRSYHPDGSLQSERWFEVGIPHGIGREWHANGRLRSESEYAHGRVIQERWWDEHGNEIPDVESR